MEQIITFLSSVLGLIMDLFFRGLTLVGYPRLWACIVLYAIVSRLFFLPDRIQTYKNRLLGQVVNLDLLEIDPDFFSKTKDKEINAKRAILRREVEKKYKISNRSGCLVSVIQYPFLVALFYVVKNPQEFVPSLEALASTSSQVVSFLGVALTSSPSDYLGVPGMELVSCVPILMVLLNFLKMFRSLKRAKTVSQKIKIYSLCGALTLLMGSLSATLPLAISLYWVTNDVTNNILDYAIKKCTHKNPKMVAIMLDYNERLRVMREKKAQEENEPSIQPASYNEAEAGGTADADSICVDACATAEGNQRIRET